MNKEVFEEILAENFPKLVKDINLQIQKAQQISERRNSMKSITKLLKTRDREKSLKQPSKSDIYKTTLAINNLE